MFAMTTCRSENFYAKVIAEVDGTHIGIHSAGGIFLSMTVDEAKRLIEITQAAIEEAGRKA